MDQKSFITSGYVLMNQIGRGSFGQVFRARKKYTGMIVAIKMISKSTRMKRNQGTSSFRQEVELLRQVEHPNIMKVIDIFETTQDFCLVSEFAEGDLRSVIRDHNQLPESQISIIAAQLVSALAYLHDNNIIHHDIKPENVLIMQGSIVKLCDFGLARTLTPSRRSLHSIKGTPLYMAPELIKHDDYTEAIDLWSLGILLYELCFGEPPFVSTSMNALASMIEGTEIQYPRPISKEFLNFLTATLKRNPAERSTFKQLLTHPFIAGVELSHYQSDVSCHRMIAYQNMSVSGFESQIQDELCRESPT